VERRLAFQRRGRGIRRIRGAYNRYADLVVFYAVGAGGTGGSGSGVGGTGAAGVIIVDEFY
jgi:hypothetical protein